MKEKLQKKDYIYMAILILIMNGIIMMFLKFKYIYGSKTDWVSQHWIIPDYFRKLFYDTGNLIPSFAPNIGGGQNIYYFSYYGLLSPTILISYLLPWVTMKDYIIASIIISVVVSILLMYKWIRGYFKEDISFCATFLFMCAGSLIFHSHRHIMFISYMPFLILALFSIDYYFKYHKRGFLISITIFLIIMTSYFYSVGSILFLTIYAVAMYFEYNKNKLIRKKCFKDAVSFGFFVALGVLLSSIILLPTMYVLLHGRNTTTLNLDWKSLLIPQVNLQYTLYSAYSLGLGFLSITAFLYGILSKKLRVKVLSITILAFCTFDIFLYLLNGTLYIDSKALIPFLPFGIFLVAELLQQIKEHKFKPIFLILPAILGYFSILKTLSDHDEYLVLFVLDIVCTLVSVMWVYFTNFKIYKCTPILIISCISCICTNQLDRLITKDYYEDTSYVDTFQLADNLSKYDTEIYRVANTVSPLYNVNVVYNTKYYQSTIYSSSLNVNYQHFYLNEIYNENQYRNSSTLSQSGSVLFNMYMGNKYLITEGTAPVGYSKIRQQNDVSLYQNLDVFPLGYISPKVMPKSQYDTLSYPQSLEAIMTYSIVDDVTIPNVDFKSHIKPIKLQYTLKNDTQLEVYEKDNIYYLKNEEKKDVSLNLDTPLDDNTILLVRFYVDNTNNSMDNDVYITINGVKNKLSVPDWKYYNNNTLFEYVISSNEGVDSLDISFSKGIYNISNVETYTLDYSILKHYRYTLDELNIDTYKTSGDTIYGTIDASKTGYLKLSIPYDDGFTFMVDGIKQDYIMVDNAFIGIPITQGNHTIEITFKAPFLKIALILSTFGVLLLLISITYDVKR